MQPEIGIHSLYVYNLSPSASLWTTHWSYCGNPCTRDLFFALAQATIFLLSPACYQMLAVLILNLACTFIESFLFFSEIRLFMLVHKMNISPVSWRFQDHRSALHGTRTAERSYAYFWIAQISLIWNIAYITMWTAALRNSSCSPSLLLHLEYIFCVRKVRVPRRPGLQCWIFLSQLRCC